MTNVNYDSHGLKLRSCDDMYMPHVAYTWKGKTGETVHCWGAEVLPKDAVEKYCTPGCDCGHCASIRKGLLPRTIMCVQRWDALTLNDQIMISESVGD